MDECANQRKFKTVTIAIVSVAVTAVVAVLVFLLARYFIFTPVMSDDLFDFTFKLDGVVYQLPCDFKDFTENGWSISSLDEVAEDTMVHCDKNVYFHFSKGNNKIFVEAYNMSENAKMLKDCKIGEIKVNDNWQNDFVIAKGIKLKSSENTVEKAFGAPYGREKYSCSFTESINYKHEINDKYNGAYFLFNSFDNKECVSITLRNIIKTDEDK